jgi:hypothetical protein
MENGVLFFFKRGLASPLLVERYGGWKNVYEVTSELIAAYPDGEPICGPF